MKTCVPTEIRSLERLITDLVYKCRAEISTIFDDFLVYVIHGFSPGEKNLENWKYGKEETAMFYQMYVKWIQIMNVQVDALGWYDVLGELYMSCIAGNARKNSLTAPNCFELPSGRIDKVGGQRGKLSTWCRFPQCSPDLKVRWCSSYLKIDVCLSTIINQKRFRDIRTLVLSGERGEESAARAKYNIFEPDRADL